MSSSSLFSKWGSVWLAGSKVCIAGVIFLLISCASGDDPVYTVGGTVGGLAGSGLVLQNNVGDDLSITADGRFTFATPLPGGANYAVTVKSQPRMLVQTCTVSAGSGTVPNALVDTVQVDCVTPAPRFAYISQAARNTVTRCLVDAGNGGITCSSADSMATGTGPISVAIDPSNRFVYVANNSSNNISAYTVDESTGALAAVAGSPFGTGTNPYQITIAPDGRFVYTANSGSSTISAFEIDAVTGALLEISGSPFPAGSGSRSFQISPSGEFGFGTAPAEKEVWTFQIDLATGALNKIDRIAPSAGVSGIGLAIDPGGRFLYAPNYEWSNPTYVSAFAADALTGSLTEVSGSPFQADGGACWAAVDPTGRYTYVANLESSSVVAFSINQTSGALTRIGSYPAGATASDFVTVDPSGKYVFVGNDWGTVSGYVIGSTTGALTPMGGSPFPLPAQSGYGSISVAILAQ